MSSQEEKREVRIDLEGLQPPPGKEWCAPCVMEYMGALLGPGSNETDKIKKLTDAAIKRNPNLTFVKVGMPNRPDLRLDVAVTHAPTWTHPQLGILPTCWSHVRGTKQETMTPAEAATQRLIPGKKFGMPDGSFS